MVVTGRMPLQQATRCDDHDIAAKIPNIADRPESALHRFGTALGSLIKAPPINRGLLTPLITGAAGSWRDHLWQWYSLLVLSNLRANSLLNHRAMGRVRTKHSRCKYGNPLLCWCAEHLASLGLCRVVPAVPPSEVNLL